MQQFKSINKKINNNSNTTNKEIQDYVVNLHKELFGMCCAVVSTIEWCHNNNENILSYYSNQNNDIMLLKNLQNSISEINKIQTNMQLINDHWNKNIDQKIIVLNKNNNNNNNNNDNNDNDSGVFSFSSKFSMNQTMGNDTNKQTNSKPVKHPLSNNEDEFGAEGQQNM